MAKTKIRRNDVDVSFLILNHNGKKLLKIILDSIKKLNFKGTFEVVVVDNDSGDGSLDFLRNRYSYVKLVENKKNLGTSGVNSGLPYCKGKYIFFLNNDVEVEKNSLKILYDVIRKDPKIGVAAPQSINFYNRSIKSGGYWISRAFYAGHYLSDGKDTAREIPYAGMFLFRKDIADKMGYMFDPDYFIYSEDLDFCLRARLIGYKVVFVPKAAVYHIHAATIGKQKNYKLTYYMERNLLFTFLKILSFRSLVLFLPYIAVMRILAIAKDILRLQFMNVFSRVKAFLWILSHPHIIIRRRSKLQKMRKVPDREILSLFSEKHILKPQPPL